MELHEQQGNVCELLEDRRDENIYLDEVDGAAGFTGRLPPGARFFSSFIISNEAKPSMRPRTQKYLPRASPLRSPPPFMYDASPPSLMGNQY
ncbi:hypothetical protein GBF38_008566 [Nibea albiflora]|uniref:Uncharacterized protein n=1 Tax=Nibea albiflora TaxID=240163 RepID=A0ACB7EZC8_NIBAL|nr:hypothetical protein GBF38_008566 [Nibea albiflora]